MLNLRLQMQSLSDIKYIAGCLQRNQLQQERGSRLTLNKRSKLSHRCVPDWHIYIKMDTERLLEALESIQFQRLVHTLNIHIE